MSSDREHILSPTEIGGLRLPSRIVRSATYEGMADGDGRPQVDRYASLYTALARGGVGAIITGFCYISQEGRAMQARQAGIDSADQIAPWRAIVRRVKNDAPAVPLIMQIAHTGRQTLARATGRPVVGASRRRCPYCRQRVRALSTGEVENVADQFALAAARAQEAGFDAVQFHGAHGYLIHQFLSPATNRRNDRFGQRNEFLLETLRQTEARCGDGYAILLKLSGADDVDLTVEHTIDTARAVSPHVAAIEISYGTMQYAMNIFRGACPVEVALRVNPMFSQIPRLLRPLVHRFIVRPHLRRLKPFTENYNVAAARRIHEESGTPVIPVGGIRGVEGIADALRQTEAPAVALCRPLIRRPDWPARIASGDSTQSTCTQCNLCAVHCDTDRSLRCYLKREPDA